MRKKENIKNYTPEELLDAIVRNNYNVSNAEVELALPLNQLHNWLREHNMVKTLLKLSRKNQRQTDLLNAERKKNREANRAENAGLEILTEIKERLKEETFKKVTKKHKMPPSSRNASGIIMFNDVHFGELVENMGGNTYDFTVSAKRIRMHVLRAIEIFKVFNIKEVVFVMGGDMYNSDRRLDELLSNACNRSKSLMLGMFIIQQALIEINQAGFNVSVVSVVGNESRVDKDRGWVHDTATHSYDYLLHNLLKWKLNGEKGITFSDMTEHPNEALINVADQEILVVHGDNQKARDPEKMMEMAVKKYADLGHKIRYVLSGHMHASYIGEYHSRSGSTVGNNSYNWFGMQKSGRASQSIHIVRANGNIDSMKVDLTDCSHIEPYDIKKDLEAYYAKSASKLKSQTTILKVTV